MSGAREGAGDLLDACSLEVRGTDGVSLGTGVLIGPCEVLTCSHVVGDHQRVEVVEARSPEQLCGATVEKCGDREGADDLALLRLEKPLEGRGVMEFTDWERGDEFWTVGYPKRGKDHVGGRVHGLSQHHGWIQIDPTGTRKIDPGFSGCAVWVRAKNAAVGIVTHRDRDSVAYAITARQIHEFWPQLARLPQPAPATTTPGIPNVGYARLVRIIDQQSGDVAGHGLRLHATWVVTLAEVAAAASGLAIEDPSGSRFRKRKAKVVWPLEPRQGDARVVLLETAEVRGLAPVEEFAPDAVARGTPWRALGYPVAAAGPMERIGLCGRVGVRRAAGWTVEFEGQDAASFEAGPWAGAAVFVDPGGRDRWRLLGVLGVCAADAGGGLEIRSLAALKAWERFKTGREAAAAASRWTGYLSRVGSHLRRPEVQLAILAVDPEGTWGPAAHDGADQLAHELCLKSEPDLLAEALSQAYCTAVEARQAETAEQVFSVLMEALPAAMASSWQIELPDGSATEVRLELLNRVLAEFALAAAEGGSAEFHTRPDRSDADFPRATHQIAKPGELGADPEGEEAANELARELELRLAFDVAGSSGSQKEVDRFTAVLAARRHRGDDPRLIDRTELEELAHASAAPEGSWRPAILNVLNRRLARGTSSGRKLYLVAGGDEQHLIAGLRRHLPELHIVTLEAHGQQFEDYEPLLDALKKAFYRRQNRERSPS